MEGINGKGYLGNHLGAPQILQGTPNYNVEISEGQNPPGEFYPAHYLPVVQSENRLQGSWYVFMPGKVVAFDTNKRLIPAGLAWDKEKYDVAYAAEIAGAVDPVNPTVGEIADAVLAGQGATSLTYSANDATAGVISASGGTYVADGDSIVDGMIAAGLGVTDPIGIMRYSALMAPGTDPSNPATFFKHAYDTGGARAFSRWCYIQVPVIETAKRVEPMTTGSNTHRFTVYSDGSGFVFKKDTVVQTLAQKANPMFMTTPTVAGTPDQYVVIGRTILFNDKLPAGAWVCEYMPKVDLPFTCMTIAGASEEGDRRYTNMQLANLLGDTVSYDINSNFIGSAAGGSNGKVVGRVLDVKVGTDKDLALVRTYYRDQGLWQEAPGTATDGRNAILAVSNAPKYIAKIAVNFNTFWV